jgi:hypothetical protein
MGIIQATFDWAGNFYSNLFADWLHINFILRTVLILFVLWLIIFLFAQLIQYVVAPLALMFFYHVIFRAWNFLFVETPHEWIYIRYHSKDKPNFSAWYLRLCDKVKRNRIILSHTKFKGMMLRSRKFATHLMFICAVAATLWASAFGLHHEYATPVLLIINEEEILPEENEEPPEEEPSYYEEEPPYYPADDEAPTAAFEENAVFTLNDLGRDGARLRDGPGIANQTVIEILWHDATLLYLNEAVPDDAVNGLFWLKVQSADGTIGYISSQLIN